jgi:hypothetical protein
MNPLMRLSDFEEIILAVVIILSSLLPFLIFSRIRAFIAGKNNKKTGKHAAEKEAQKRTENHQDPAPILNRLIMERREAQRKQEQASGIKTLEPRSLIDEGGSGKVIRTSALTASRRSGSVLQNTAWKRINRLPPLKRAVVLSEVLDKPQALKDGFGTTGR